MNKANLFTFVTIVLTCFFPNHLVAGPCDQGITLVNPLTGLVEIDGVDIGNNTVVDTTFEIRNDGALVLQQVTPGNRVHQGNRFNPSTAQVELDCVVFKENTYHVKLDLAQEGGNTLLRIDSLGEVFDPALTTNWTVNYSNNFADDPLIINADRTATLSTFPGSYQISPEQQILIDLGSSDFTGTVGIGLISGNFNHFGENGTFVATPSERTQTPLLNNNRFQVEVDWVDGANSGKGEAVPVTNDSAAFFFFDPYNVEILVRVLDGCSFNDRFWVFAGGLTDVEYTLTITDTSLGTQRVLNAPEGGAINDTGAFSACP